MDWVYPTTCGCRRIRKNITSRKSQNCYLSDLSLIHILPVIIQLIKACGLPVERYFNPEIMREESEQRQRVSHKLKLCPEEYLPIIEGAIDSAIQIEKPCQNETEDV